MNIRVLFFASLREDVGVEALRVELEEGTYAQLREQLTATLGNVADVLWADNVRLACNQELLAGQPGELVFKDGDELAFLPPVTGG